MTTGLIVDGLCVERGGNQLLSGIDLSVRAGEIVAVLGPNGVGKSTLLSACAGLIEPCGGRVSASGRVAMVLQAPVLADRSVLANVELALRWSRRGLGRDERHRLAVAALDRLGVGHLADRSAAALSGGERRRVHLARGLVVDPAVLLLDEPFAGLDVATRADLLFDAQSALRSPSRATVVVVHDRAEAWALADRVAVLLDGKLAQVGAPDEVFARPATERVAEFVGFTGRIFEGSQVHRVRIGDVRVDDDGPHEARVVRRVPVEDGIRVELASDAAVVTVISPAPGPSIGSSVRFSVLAGRSYPSGG